MAKIEIDGKIHNWYMQDLCNYTREFLIDIILDLGERK